jgi:recombinational DNA repair protein RecR
MEQQKKTCFNCDSFNKTYNQKICNTCWDEKRHKNWTPIKDEREHEKPFDSKEYEALQNGE